MQCWSARISSEKISFRKIPSLTGGRQWRQLGRPWRHSSRLWQVTLGGLDRRHQRRRKSFRFRRVRPQVSQLRNRRDRLALVIRSVQFGHRRERNSALSKLLVVVNHRSGSGKVWPEQSNTRRICVNRFRCGRKRAFRKSALSGSSGSGQSSVGDDSREFATRLTVRLLHRGRGEHRAVVGARSPVWFAAAVGACLGPVLNHLGNNLKLKIFNKKLYHHSVQ